MFKNAVSHDDFKSSCDTAFLIFIVLTIFMIMFSPKKLY